MVSQNIDISGLTISMWGNSRFSVMFFLIKSIFLEFHLLFERNCKTKIVNLILSKGIPHGLHYDFYDVVDIIQLSLIISLFLLLYFSYFFLQKCAFLRLVKSWLALGSLACSSHRLATCQNSILISYTNNKEEE